MIPGIHPAFLLPLTAGPPPPSLSSLSFPSPSSSFSWSSSSSCSSPSSLFSSSPFPLLLPFTSISPSTHPVKNFLSLLALLLPLLLLLLHPLLVSSSSSSPSSPFSPPFLSFLSLPPPYHLNHLFNPSCLPSSPCLSIYSSLSPAFLAYSLSPTHSFPLSTQLLSLFVWLAMV